MTTIVCNRTGDDDDDDDRQLDQGGMGKYWATH